MLNLNNQQVKWLGGIKKLEINYNSLIDIFYAGFTGFTVGATYGGLYGGLASGGVFLTSSIVDEIFISYKIFDKHYITSTLLWSRYSSLFLEIIPTFYRSFLTSWMLPGLLGALISWRTIDIFINAPKFVESYESYKLLQELLSSDWEKFSKSFYYAISIKIGQIITNISLNLFMGSLLNRSFLLGHILNGVDIQAPNLKTFIKYSVYSGLILTKELVLNYISDHLVEIYSQDMTKLILRKSNKLISNKGISRKLKSVGFEGQELEGKLIHNFFLAKKSALSITENIENLFDLQAAVFMCGKRLPKVILPSIVLGIIFDPILEEYVTNQKNITIENKISYARAQEIINNIKFSADSVSIRGGESFLENNLETFLDEFGVSDWQRKKIEQGKNGVHKLVDVVNFILPLLSFSFENPLRDINPQNLGEQNQLVSSIAFATSYLGKWSNLALANSISNSTNMEHNIANMELRKFINLIDSDLDFCPARILNEDKNIAFKNYSIFVNQQEILRINDLKLTLGKHYAVNGANGIGKSSLMIDIKTGLVGNIFSSGEMSLPKDHYIFMLDQSAYLPSGISLRDKIRFPIVYKNLSENDKKWLDNLHNDLLTELELFGKKINSEFFDKENYELSGGMRKKIGIIQIIAESMLKMRSESIDSSRIIIILDESFAEIEHSSRTKIKKLLNEFLPLATFLVVDHDSNSNNADGFYDSYLSFISYNLKMIRDEESKLAPNEIGIKCSSDKIFLKTSTSDSDFELEEEFISRDLYNILKNNCFSNEENASIERKYFREIKEMLLKKGYINYDTWVVEMLPQNDEKSSSFTVGVVEQGTITEYCQCSGNIDANLYN